MTIIEAKSLKEGQEIYYRGIEDLPEKVIVSKIMDNRGKLEIHLADNCYIPERDLQDYIFLTFDECAEMCKKVFESKLDKLRKMLNENK